LGIFSSYWEIKKHLAANLDNNHTYKVVWWSDVKGCTETSFFYAPSIMQVVGKFMDIPPSKIQSIELQPAS
jgi:hypothetical protein